MKKVVANSRLISLLNSLSKSEREGLGELLTLKYFNNKPIVAQLYQVLKVEGFLFDKQKTWHQLYPDTPFNDGRIRVLTSQLTRLVEQFLAFNQITQDTADTKKQAAQRLKATGHFEVAERLAKEAHQKRVKVGVRHADYWLELYRFDAEQFQKQLFDQPKMVETYATIHERLEVVLYALKFRQRTMMANHALLYKRELPNSAFDRFLDQLEENDLPNEPAIRIYYYCYQLLSAEHPAEAFDRFKTVLFAHSQVFPKAEALGLYLVAINFGIRQVNAGQRNFFPAIMDLYKDALERGYLLSTGKLSRFTYHNMITIALQTDEADWANDFIENWTNKLERRYRERMYHFNRARIAYARKEYDAALPLLQRANYHDSLLNLGARTLLLKIYYELGEWEVLESHLDAFQSYIRRKADLTYHRANYRNLIRFTRQLLKLTPGAKRKREQLREKITQTEMLTEKHWLLAQL